MFILLCQDFVPLKKEGGQESRSLEARHKLITFKRYPIAFQPIILKKLTQVEGFSPQKDSISFDEPNYEIYKRRREAGVYIILCPLVGLVCSDRH